MIKAYPDGISFDGWYCPKEHLYKKWGDKEYGFECGIVNLVDSFSFVKLTDEEKKRFMAIASIVNNNGVVKGSFRDRITIVESVYFGFLAALGYFDSHGEWRDEQPTKTMREAKRGET